MLEPRRSRYTLLGPGGGVAGHEDLAIDRDANGWVVNTEVAAGAPWDLTARVTWHLGDRLETRVLAIATRNGFGEGHEVELAFTGNGVLAHRRGPDGPSQIELGWGPRAEVDYLSAVFSEVTLRRLAARHVVEEDVECLSIDAETLEPVVVTRRYRRLADSAWACEVAATSHHARLMQDGAGVLVEYEGLFRLDGASPA